MYATADGVVTNNSDKGNGFGIYVEIDHQYGYVTTYAHMSKVAVKVGQRVKRGDIIGYVGSTGISTSPHLHYEVKKDGVKVDPVHYFFSDITPEEFKKLKDEASEYGQSFD
ncbi:MAG: M23 family metallopeptidase [Bacteroidia bacterium]|nr:M23 family metallopeptidase [Bacteroidia bacterium]